MTHTRVISFLALSTYDYRKHVLRRPVSVSNEKTTQSRLIACLHAENNGHEASHEEPLLTT